MLALCLFASPVLAGMGNANSEGPEEGFEASVQEGGDIVDAGAAGEGDGAAGEGDDDTSEGDGAAGEGDGAAGEGDGAAGEGDGAAGEGDDAAGEGDDAAGEGDDAAGEGEGDETKVIEGEKPPLAEEPAELALVAGVLTAELYIDGDYTARDETDKTVITLDGLFPADAYAKAFAVELVMENEEVLAAYDITIFYLDDEGEEQKFEPGESVLVGILLEEAPVLEEDQLLNVVHIPDVEEGIPVPEFVETKVAMNEVTGAFEFEVAHFSTYALTLAGINANQILFTLNGTTSLVTFTRTGTTAYTYTGTFTAPRLLDGASHVLNIGTSNGSYVITEVTATNGAVVGDDNAVTLTKQTVITVKFKTSTASTAVHTINLTVNPNATTPQEIGTVDTTALGLNMYLFDYKVGGTIGTGSNVRRASSVSTGTTGYSNGLMAGANGGSALTPGLLSRNVGTDGFPIVAANGRSLNQIFSMTGASSTYLATAGNAGGARQVNHLFLQSTYEDTGYLEYDSNYAFATLRNTSGTLTNDFTVYNAVGSAAKFMPYNRLNWSSSAGTVNGKPSYNFLTGDATDSGANNGNYFFGLYATGEFYMPKDGQVTGGDMEFAFTGDDDLWVFIDGVLVLDIGGAHTVLSGSINFATGVVTGSGTGGATTIKAQFQAAGKDTATGFKGNTFADYTKHKIQIFYMEREESDSNLRMRLNLPIIKTGLEVTKEVPSVHDEQLRDVDFEMYLYTETSTNVFQKVTNEPYTVYNADYSVQIRSGTLGSDGKFTLKRDEHIVFTGGGIIQENQRFFVVENVTDLVDYVQFAINGGALIDGQAATDLGLPTGNGEQWSRSEYYTFSLTEGKTDEGGARLSSVTVKNVPPGEEEVLCEISVTKAFPGLDGTVTSGITFTLYKVDDDSTEHAFAPISYADIVAAGGTYTFDGLLPGTYYIVESTPESTIAGQIYRSTAFSITGGWGGTSGAAVRSANFEVHNGASFTSKHPAETFLAEHAAATVSFSNRYGSPTFELILEKVDGAGAPLNGAGFELWQYGGSGWEKINPPGYDASDESTWYYFPATDPADPTGPARVRIEELENGTYKLVEMKVPVGYAKLDDIYFMISSDVFYHASLDGSNAVVKGAAFAQGEFDDGIPVITATNIAFYELPDTGGRGTAGFAVFGILATLSAMAALTLSVFGTRRYRGRIRAGSGDE